MLDPTFLMLQPRHHFIRVSVLCKYPCTPKCKVSRGTYTNVSCCILFFFFFMSRWITALLASNWPPGTNKVMWTELNWIEFLSNHVIIMWSKDYDLKNAVIQMWTWPCKWLFCMYWINSILFTMLNSHSLHKHLLNKNPPQKMHFSKFCFISSNHNLQIWAFMKHTL